MGGRGAKSTRAPIVKAKLGKFDKFRFAGMDIVDASNQYYRVSAVSNDESKIIVNFGPEHVKKTPYGYAVTVAEGKTVYVKDWAVNDSWKAGGMLVMFDKAYYKPRDTKYVNDNLYMDKTGYKWNDMLKIAKMQKQHHWKKKDKKL